MSPKMIAGQRYCVTADESGRKGTKLHSRAIKVLKVLAYSNGKHGKKFWFGNEYEN